MCRKLVSLAIYISLYIGVPTGCWNSAPNLYKQGAAPIERGDHIKEDERREIKRDREGVSAEPIRE